MTTETQREERARECLAAVSAVLEAAPELNMSNYDHDQVAELNAAMVEATLLTRATLEDGQKSASRGEGDKMTLPETELLAVVSRMHTAWMGHEELKAKVGGFELMGQMADKLGLIRDSVPELWQRTQAALASPQPTDVPGIVIDLEHEFMAQLRNAASESQWIPHDDYCVNDWINDCCSFLRDGPQPTDGWVRIEDEWQPMDSAPKDGSLLELAVDYTDGEHPLQDALIAATIGYNGLDDTGEDEWKFAGWCWSHDHFTEGKGKVIAWRASRLNEQPPAA